MNTLSEAATSWPAPVPPAESGVGVVSRTERAEGEAGDSEVRLCEPTALDGALETALGASELAPETALGASEVLARVVTRPVAKWSIEVFTRFVKRPAAKWSIEVFTRVVTRPVAKWSMRTCHQRSSEPISGHQRLSKLIRGNQRSSEPIRAHQWPFAAISVVIREHQWSFMVIRGRRRPSEVISSGHQWSSMRTRSFASSVM